MASLDVISLTSADPSAKDEKTSANHRPLWSLKRWFGKDDNLQSISSDSDGPERPRNTRRLSRKVIPGLPRPGTFKRQQSELRDNLEPAKYSYSRRAVSADRRNLNGLELSPSCGSPPARLSAPVVMDTVPGSAMASKERNQFSNRKDDKFDRFTELPENSEPKIAAPIADADSLTESRRVSFDRYDDDLMEELEKKWILNLSMHFRDRSNREKFFVTYEQTPGQWRRVTISLDYRDPPPSSLEAELQSTRFQRDKSSRIYESIRQSLPEIQFYPTVTNLKLQTENDRLHVHVTEDIHEVIHFPPVSAINHLRCRLVREDTLEFDAHLSGFVYKVRLDGKVFIKKEIPGPDTVEEFLYEINALHRLSGSCSVIQFGGVVVDSEQRHLKGLLISFAEKGALIDVLYEGKGNLPWKRRELWARQVTQGLSEIHEAGFVQGDFTLSNIVIDADDKAKIIDINRRGCPVGWEPPEVAALIESKQRISMYIGVKSDIFQLGMVLWAIAMQQDEPEVQPRPLILTFSADQIPDYYRAIVGLCLSDDPSKRCHATALLGMFPDAGDDEGCEAQLYPKRNSSYRSMDGTITTVGRDDFDENSQFSATHSYGNGKTDTSGEPYIYLDGSSINHRPGYVSSAEPTAESASKREHSDRANSHDQSSPTPQTETSQSTSPPSRSVINENLSG